MAHRALTLKYRPQSFADMVGQEHVSTVLKRALESGRIAHAYLFTGARGVGKTTSARILAKALNCEKRGKGAEPCNECTSCREITSGVSLDVAEIDGASNRGIADVQALREKVRFSPTGGRYRVLIIDEVHQLSNDAFAALLKTLEEPPPHLVFVFATTDPQKLPDTIRSRTQRYDFARVPVRKIADRLLDIAKREAKDPEGLKFKLTDGAALLIGHHADGSMRDAVSGLDQVVTAGEPEITDEVVRRVLGIPDREAFFAIADAIVARDPQATLRALHAAFDKGVDVHELAEGLSQHVRHILVLAVDSKAGDLVAATSEDLARLRREGEGWAEHDLLRLLRIITEVQSVMRESPQPMVHLEAAVLQMATLERGETLAQLLDRVEALEKRLGGGSAPAGGTGTAPARGAAPKSGAREASAPVTASHAANPAPVRAPVKAPPLTAPPTTPPSYTVRALSSIPGSAVTPVTGRPASAPAVAPVTARSTSSPAAPTAVLEAEEIELDEGISLQWSEVVAGVNRRKRMLGAFLEESRFLGRRRDGLVIAADDLHTTVIDEKENRALVAEETRRVFGYEVQLRFVPLSAAGPPPRRATNDDVAPMVERAMAWFEAEPVGNGRGKETRSS